jgi:hypothetical protein
MREVRPLRLYSVTGPDGRRYIGCTHRDLAVRWRGHLDVARSPAAVPRDSLHAEIRRRGPEVFEVLELAVAFDAVSARRLEEQLIAQWGTLAPSGFNRTAFSNFYVPGDYNQIYLSPFRRAA